MKLALKISGAVALTGVLCLVSSWRASSATKVKLRGVVHLLNALKRKPETESEIEAVIKPAIELFEKVLAAERAAFSDDAAADSAKKSLFMMQLRGVFEKGNSFSAFGQISVMKDLMKGLNRRIAFASSCSVALPTPSSLKSYGSNVVIIGGLPRTGSTMLHRLLAADPATRTPLWWEQMHDDPSPCPPGELRSDRRAAEVQKDIDKIGIVSPNAVEELNKFHKIGATEVEECAPFIRRYFNDMDSLYMSPACTASRSAWCTSPSVDRSFLVRHLQAWLSLQSLAIPPSSPKRWVLKAPIFTVFLPELAAGFPDAAFVFTSRDPKNVIPSTCGLVEVAAAFKADWGADPSVLMSRIGEYVLGRMEHFASLQSEFVESRGGREGGNVTCLRYQDVMEDKIGEVAKIYEARSFSHDTIKITIIDHNDPSSPGPVTVTAKVPLPSDESQDVTDPFDPSHVPLNMMTLCQQNSMEIEGACGGELACSTCHVLFSEGDLERVGTPGEEEEDMLDLAYGLEEGRSRLGCQVRIGKEMDGMTVEIPEDPY
ncbi:hypothetical protein TrRE_jg812 [Triparma retinervis]|uniref:2Fe-2S ferredoxin-type domain-containing protein n=1 Tax=Triparma retinervis TaxID=2557542 RepID=A0A9W7A8K9_9STRA|nr:hypothetical protein TrRE_jg812 [Triparma retinervis]